MMRGLGSNVGGRAIMTSYDGRIELFMLNSVRALCGYD